MAWFKVDDGFYTSIKFLSIPREYQTEAAGLWLLAGTWSADKLTDGFVPYAVMDMWHFKNETVAQLIAVGLWRHDEERSGIEFHDWCDYQPTREALTESRTRTSNARSEAGKLGGLRSGEARRSKTEANLKQNEAPNPNPYQNKTITRTSSASVETEDFKRFWEAYNHKLDKKAAIKAFAKAVTLVSAETIIEKAGAYANDPNRPLQKNAATWLNGECWNNPPYPARPVPAWQAKQDVDPWAGKEHLGFN